MSKSPLSGAFADSSATTKKKNKKNGAILLIAGIALTSSIGGVFAANSITINSGDAIEFGQGVAATTSCTAALTTNVTQEFVTGTTFRVKDVEVSNINSDCEDQGLRVALLAVDNSELTNTTLRPASGETSKTWNISTSLTVTADLVRKVVVTTED